ncbi:hypothetical protein [Peribacillus sp. V2I11]|uniref:hypothetical protein n=1 Tax=Peribacillus sp. V2I11 TaxID=3042277 RepID=UPI00277FD0A9|nr:hypothetical protein [Peribacillus sp. V2I11]MDQ0884706.1 hypothetical protein [Peribacillus sp. V2I11]
MALTGQDSLRRDTKYVFGKEVILGGAYVKKDYYKDESRGNEIEGNNPNIVNME